MHLDRKSLQLAYDGPHIMESVRKTSQANAFITQDHLQEIEALFARAEQSIKNAEMDGYGLPIPPINELRYATRHLLNAFIHTNDHNYCDEHIARCKRHCLRAIYDAQEIPVIGYIDCIKGFFESYDIEIIDLFIKDHRQKRIIVRAAQDKAQHIRSTGNDDREKHADWCAKQHNILRDIYREFEDVELDLRQKTHQRRNRELLKLTGTVVAILTAITGCFVTIWRFLIG